MVLGVLVAAVAQLSAQDAIQAARRFVAAAKLPVPAASPSARVIAGLTVSWGSYTFDFYPGSKWPNSFMNDTQAGAGRSRFTSKAAARTYATAMGAALHVPRTAVVTAFKFASGSNTFEVDWADTPPAVSGKRLPGLNRCRAVFRTRDGVLKFFSGGWGITYATPLVKLTPADAERAALTRRPSWFKLGGFHSTTSPTNVALVWAMQRIDASGQPLPFDWNGTAKVGYKVTFGTDYLVVDAASGALMEAAAFKAH